MAYTVIAYIVMAYTVTAYTVTAYIVMAHRVMARLVNPTERLLRVRRPRAVVVYRQPSLMAINI